MNYKNNPSREIKIGDPVIGTADNLKFGDKPRVVAGTVVDLRPSTTQGELDKIVVFTPLRVSPDPAVKNSSYQVVDAIGEAENFIHADDAIAAINPPAK